MSRPMKMARRNLRGLLVGASVCFSPVPAFAWGALGHRVVAAIAADELTPAARAQVVALLGGDDAKAAMISVSTWADEIRRQRPQTAPWHFADVPESAAAYDAHRDCPGDDCVVAQIERDARIVGDRQLAPPVRAEALRYLVHFAADVHQPLHCSDNGDRGGNAVRVIIGQRQSNLHAIFDTDLVSALGRDPGEVAARLESEITPEDRRIWSFGTPAAWCTESHHVAQREIYERFAGQGGTTAPIVLPPLYAMQESSLVAVQLQKGGVRLAAVLNAQLR